MLVTSIPNDSNAVGQRVVHRTGGDQSRHEQYDNRTVRKRRRVVLTRMIPVRERQMPMPAQFRRVIVVGMKTGQVLSKMILVSSVAMSPG